MTSNSPTLTVESADAKAKKIVERSAKYPYFTISETLEVVTQIHQHYPNSSVKAEDADAVIENNAYTHRYLSTAVQYGLMVREKGEYKVTDIFIRIHKFLSEQEKKNDLITLFSSPPLYKVLITNYNGHVVPDELATILFRKHEIADKATLRAAKVFIDNGKFIGVIDEKNILRINLLSAFEQLVENKMRDGVESEVKPSPPLQAPTKQLPPHNVNDETDIVRVTKANTFTLIYPADVNEKDIEIVRKHLETIELRIKLKKEES